MTRKWEFIGVIDSDRTTHSSMSSLDITISHIATLSVVLFTVALIVPHMEQQSIAQEEQQPPYNRTAFDTENPIKDLSFSINDVPEFIPS